MIRTVKELYNYREMISSLIKRDLRGKYKASALGFLWTFLIPLFQLVIYNFIFSTILMQGLADLARGGHMTESVPGRILEKIPFSYGVLLLA